MPNIGSGQIDSVVVVMLENHSFDSVLGWLYGAQKNVPPVNIPAPLAGHPPSFDGLAPQTFWNSIPPGNPAHAVYASLGTNGNFTWPNPNPQELFSDMTAQIFGAYPPPLGALPDMSGCLASYAQVQGANPATIMACYGPGDLPAHAWLATQFAVCDRWFGGCPTETFPNRGFLHAGTSFGRVNGCDGQTEYCIPDSAPYRGQRTLFYALQQIGMSWNVYNDSSLISAARFQFQDEFWDSRYDGNFSDFSQFQSDAAAGRLPSYCFIEPSFIFEPNDGHPPHDMRAADQFLSDIWDAVRTSPQWPNILLVILYDEHGGCYDHTPTPLTAVNPDNSPPQYPAAPFDFTRYGPRVPAIVASAWIEPGTVFRAPPGGAEFDHASVAATVRDWLGLPSLPAPFQSRRVDAAPTLAPLLTRIAPRLNLPGITPITGSAAIRSLAAETPLHKVQRAVIAGTLARAAGANGTVARGAGVRMAMNAVRSPVMMLQTEQDAIDRLTQNGLPPKRRRR